MTKTTTVEQQGDVNLFHTVDGGEITVTEGIVEMVAGLQVSAYLALFGGNEHDDGIDDTNPNQYWGNFIETDPAERLRSRTQHLLRSLPAVSGNLRRLEEAAKLDLAYLLSERIANSVVVSATIPALNRVRLVIEIGAYGEEFEFEYTENWKASV